MSIVTRFAPSPTGFLHIGGVRTALFNWLFSKANNGKFLLRIEDTDRSRSTNEAVNAILEGLKWLDINWDDELVMQFSRAKRHIEVAEQLLDIGLAYRCYLSAEEIQAIRQHDPHAKIESPWRDLDKPARVGVSPTIRLKVPRDGITIINDKIKGTVSVDNKELDDMVLLRSDKTPTYMLAVVVDDYDMNITHVIRGDDHFTNTFRQNRIIKALSWPEPVYAHIPLIHGSDGAKLSKRHGALGVSFYRDAGYLPEALNNYLLRLGWSYDDIEIIPKEEAIKLFSLEDINNAPARFDYDKLNFINSQYIVQKDNDELVNMLKIENEVVKQRIRAAMSDLKIRSKTIIELQEISELYSKKKNPPDDKSKEILASIKLEIIEILKKIFSEINNWKTVEIKGMSEKIAIDLKMSKGQMMQILRALIIGSFQSPGIYETMEILGQDEVLSRLANIQK